MPQVIFSCIGESTQACQVQKPALIPQCTSSWVGHPRARGQDVTTPASVQSAAPESWPQGRVPPPAGGSALLRGMSAAAPEEWDWNVPVPKEEALDKGGRGRGVE